MKSYMLISIIFLILSYVPFACMYRRHKPRAREVVLIAVMSSLTVIANVICAYTVPFHAGTALVIVTGIAFGPQAGFLTGNLSRFVCNFFMGQGLWTPWQMAAWGMLGAIAGILFNKTEINTLLDDEKAIKKKHINQGLAACMPFIICEAFAEILGYLHYLFTKQANETFFGFRLYAFGVAGIIMALIFTRKKLPVNFITTAVFTFISVFVLYGGIMNIAALFMNNAVEASETGGMSISIEALKLLYITGAPYDALHALGASVCMLLFGDSLLGKLERVKIKFGMYKSN